VNNYFNKPKRKSNKNKITLIGFELPPETIYHLILSFYYLDFNDNGLLEMDEIIQGFILMGKGTEAEKIECAFMICDKDGNNLLDINELEFYLHAVIRMSRGKNFDGVKRFEAEREIGLIAKALSHKVFEEIDSDKNGKISLEEFRLWHNVFRKGGQDHSGNRGDVLGIMKHATNLKNDKLISSKIKNDPKRYEALQKQKITSLNGHTSTIDRIRTKQRDLNLEMVTMTHLNKVVNRRKTSERLNRNEFLEFICEVLEEANVERPQAAKLTGFANQIFRLLDADGNNLLDWSELLGGLSLLIGGSQKDKVQTLFRVFDKNGDEILTFKELFFLLKSSYTILLYKNPLEELKKQSPEELAFAATKKCFTDSNIPIEGGINFVQFQNWYGA
jgi:Ca2+-binding EF-hand superfamily protein